MAKKAKKSVKKTAENSKYACNECGLVVSVDEGCGCLDAHELVCCGTKMKPKK